MPTALTAPARIQWIGRLRIIQQLDGQVPPLREAQHLAHGCGALHLFVRAGAELATSSEAGSKCICIPSISSNKLGPVQRASPAACPAVRRLRTRRRQLPYACRNTEMAPLWPATYTSLVLQFQDSARGGRGSGPGAMGVTAPPPSSRSMENTPLAAAAVAAGGAGSEVDWQEQQQQGQRRATPTFQQAARRGGEREGVCVLQHPPHREARARQQRGVDERERHHGVMIAHAGPTGPTGGHSDAVPSRRHVQLQRRRAVRDDGAHGRAGLAHVPQQHLRTHVRARLCVLAANQGRRGAPRVRVRVPQWRL